MRYGCLVIVLLLATRGLSAQDSRLAQQYFQNGEYEKAAAMYDDLYQKNGNNDFFFDRYFQCLLALEQYSEAEQVLQKQIRKNNGNVKLYVSFGTLLERVNRYDEAEEQYQLAIDRLPTDQYSVTRLANAFIGKTKYKYAIATYERGAELMKDKRIFSQNLGDLYRRMGESKPMINAYLNALEDNPDRIRQLKITFSRYLSK
ncbi:MAG: tetratricopeptide repeat protein, partial [Bacteroidota bacterium]